MEIEAWHHRLLREKEALQALSEASRESRGAVTLDQQGVGRLSRMNAMQQQAMALEAERRRQIRLKRIEAALQRIDSGDFGYCAKCGEPIPESRLEIDPISPSCVNCTAI